MSYISQIPQSPFPTYSDERWATREEARRDLFGYIEGSYNWQRIHSALAYLTPEQAERQMVS